MKGMKTAGKKVNKVSTPEMVPKSNDEWQIRDDADKVKRYAELKNQEPRHKKAMDYIRNEHEVIFGMNEDGGRIKPRGLARAGRKASMKRRISRRA